MDRRPNSERKSRLCLAFHWLSEYRRWPSSESKPGQFRLASHSFVSYNDLRKNWPMKFHSQTNGIQIRKTLVFVIPHIPAKIYPLLFGGFWDWVNGFNRPDSRAGCHIIFHSWSGMRKVRDSILTNYRPTRFWDFMLHGVQPTSSVAAHCGKKYCYTCIINQVL